MSFICCCHDLQWLWDMVARTSNGCWTFVANHPRHILGSMPFGKSTFKSIISVTRFYAIRLSMYRYDLATRSFICQLRFQGIRHDPLSDHHHDNFLKYWFIVLRPQSIQLYCHSGVKPLMCRGILKHLLEQLPMPSSMLTCKSFDVANPS